jgi:hypothetical protein
VTIEAAENLFPVSGHDSKSDGRTNVLYQGTTLEVAEKLTKVPKGQLNLAQDVILGSRIEDE